MSKFNPRVFGALHLYTDYEEGKWGVFTHKKTSTSKAVAYSMITAFAILAIWAVGNLLFL